MFLYTCSRLDAVPASAGKAKAGMSAD